MDRKLSKSTECKVGLLEGGSALGHEMEDMGHEQRRTAAKRCHSTVSAWSIILE